jgi:hypothetical protein
MKREPIAIIEAIKTIANLVIIWLVLMGYWTLSEEQQAITITLALAIINLGGMFWQRSLSTPVAEPRAENVEGRIVDLVPADGSALKD